MRKLIRSLTRRRFASGGAMPPFKRRGDTRVVQLSPGHVPPEVVAMIGKEAARELNRASRLRR